MDDAVSTPMQSGGVHEEQDASASKGVEEEDMDLDQSGVFTVRSLTYDGYLYSITPLRNRGGPCVNQELPVKNICTSRTIEPAPMLAFKW